MERSCLMSVKKYLFFVFLCFSPLFLLAQNIEKKVYTIGVQDFEHYLPYSQYSNGKYSGFNRELLDMFAKSKNYTFVYSPYPIKRLYENFLNQKLDFKYPDNPYWSAKQKKYLNIKYSSKVVEYIDGVMVLPKNKNKDISKLNNLGIVAGFTPFPYLKYIKDGKIKISEVFNYENMLIRALKNREDGIYSNIAVSKYYLKNILNKEDMLVFDENLPHVRNYRYLSSIKYPHIIKEFNVFLKVHKKEINSLKRKYNIYNYLPSRK